MFGTRLTPVLAGFAAAKFKGLLFEDPLSLALVGRRWGVELDSKMYDVRTLRDALDNGYFKVPHTRRDLTATEFAAILNTLNRNIGHLDMVTVVFELPNLLKMCFVLPYDTLAYEVLDMYDAAVKTDCGEFLSSHVRFVSNGADVFDANFLTLYDIFPSNQNRTHHVHIAPCYLGYRGISV